MSLPHSLLFFSRTDPGVAVQDSLKCLASWFLYLTWQIRILKVRQIIQPLDPLGLCIHWANSHGKIFGKGRVETSVAFHWEVN